MRLSNQPGKFYAPTSDPSQTRRAEDSYPSERGVAFAGVADGGHAGTVDDGPVLADDGS